jgi:type II secretory pathway component GspD/PulD (secretin)
MTQWTKTSCLLPAALGTLLTGCGATQYEFDVDRHITKETVAQETPVEPSGVPDLVGSTAEIPDLVYEGSEEVFDIVVDNVSVRQVLLSIADQAQLDLDVDPRVEGLISMNAYGQTVQQILERIRKQLPLRFERVGDTLVVMNDELYYRQYTMDFPHLSRTYSASSSGDAPSSGGSSLGTSAVGTVKEGTGSVWSDVETAINRILSQNFNTYQPNAGPVGSSDPEGAQAAAVAGQVAARSGFEVVGAPFVHLMPDAGLLIVYASSEQHHMVSEIISRVTETSRRQVMLQATVVEIALNNNYQQGIDWSVFNAASTGPRFIQSETASWGNVLQNRSFDAINQRRAELEQYYNMNGIQRSVSIPGNYIAGMGVRTQTLVTPGTPAIPASPAVPGVPGTAAIYATVTTTTYLDYQIQKSGIYANTLSLRTGGQVAPNFWEKARPGDVEIRNPNYQPEFIVVNQTLAPNPLFNQNIPEFITVPANHVTGTPRMQVVYSQGTVLTPGVAAIPAVPGVASVAATPGTTVTTTLDLGNFNFDKLFGKGSSILIDANTGLEIPASFWDAARTAATEVLNPEFTRIQNLINNELQQFINNGVGLQPSANASNGFLNGTFRFGDLQAAVSLLDRFGDTKVVSSPRVSALNGQGAILKVVEDAIYFQTTTTSETDIDTNTTTDQTSVTQQSVPIGFVCNVYPQIGSDGTIILQMRPSVSRVTGYALPPTTGGGVASGVPIVSVKEIETLMLIQDGQTAVMGGLIEDQTLDQSVGVPGANKLPGLGSLFENKSQSSRRIEYVIFVTAKIIENPSLNGDYREYLDWLPSDETFQRDQTGSIFGTEIDKISRAK